MSTTHDLADVLDVLAGTTDTSWMTPERACLGKDPELFFPVGESEAFADQIREAKQVCAGCPVKTQCLKFGMAQSDGIFGGLTAGERRKMRAAAKRTTAHAQQGDGERFPAKQYSTDEARRLFRALIDEMRAAGRVTIRTRDIPAEFYANVRSRAWALYELHRLCDIRVLARTTIAGVFVVDQRQVMAS